MRLVRFHSLHDGAEVWRKRGELDWLLDVFDAPDLDVRARSGQVIRQHVARAFGAHGWAMDFKIDPRSNLTVTAKNGDLAFQIQTGNIGRAAYDLLKLQHLFLAERVEAVALALPTKDAATIIGSNIANGDRIWAEAQLFRRQITAPLVIVEFE